jgi:hypothetical protein
MVFLLVDTIYRHTAQHGSIAAKFRQRLYCQYYCGWLMPSAIHVFSLHFLLRPKHVPAHAEFWEVRCFRVETPVDQENWALEIARSRIYKSLLHAQRLI